jgi:hypothetical protein
MSVMKCEKKCTTCDRRALMTFPSSYSTCLPLTGSVSAALANLGLETGLDGVHRPPRATGLASHEKDTVFLCKECVWRLACLACDILH